MWFEEVVSKEGFCLFCNLLHYKSLIFVSNFGTKVSDVDIHLTELFSNLLPNSHIVRFIVHLASLIWFSLDLCVEFKPHINLSHSNNEETRKTIPPMSLNPPPFHQFYSVACGCFPALVSFSFCIPFNLLLGFLCVCFRLLRYEYFLMNYLFRDSCQVLGHL